MFFIKLQNLAPLLKATSIFTQLANDEVCLKFSPSMFSITAQFQSPPFIAMMLMDQPFFANYSIDQNHISKISLQSFHNALSEGQRFCTMTIHLLEPLNRILLRFEHS
ncbi:unnamed protein product, partial [Citrullus colocynthis]